MGKQTRSAAEKARIQKKKAEDKAARENRVFYALIFATLAIIAAVFLFNFLKDELTLPTEIRNTASIQDNWLVIDSDNTTRKRYHHPASFDAPAGYVPGESVFSSTGESHAFTKYNDGICRDFYLLAEDENAVVNAIYVDAASELTAAGYVDNILSLYTNALSETTTATPGEPFTATIAGREALCLYLHYAEDEGHYGVLVCAFDAPRNVCVNALLSGRYTTAEEVQTQEQLLAQAEVLLAGLTIMD
ncbi:MAG: hypothetical protein IJE07_04690 [Clostridia bacterium]|nr:hypothetical protein [Clostridia bacterium]